MKKIVFLLDSISQPRCLRRINNFMDNGFLVEVYGIDRNKYSLNLTNLNFTINVISVQSEGDNYLRKFLSNLISVFKVYHKLKSNDVIFYSFGFPLTFSLFLLGSKNFVYEIADILYGYPKFNKVRFIFKFLDKIIIRRSLLTVLTSEGFAHYLFNKNIPFNIIIQPNKVNSFLLDIDKCSVYRDINFNNIIFGFVGSFRSANTILKFSSIIGERYSNHSFYFYGDSFLTEDVVKLTNRFSNIKYFGPFKNPEDLYKIYNEIDIIVACYDPMDFNETILEPNKFYESLFFRKPIVVSCNTFLANRVMKFNSGFFIDASNEENIVSFIDNLSFSSLNRILDAINSYDLTDFVDDNSFYIIDRLRKIVLN